MLEEYSCIIVDDEVHAIDTLMSRLSLLYKNVQVRNTYTTWNEAVEGLRQTNCDILFLDISIQGKIGMELLDIIPNFNGEVIFITAHDDYAMNAFKVSATGYILKPFTDAELVKTVDKAISHIHDRKLATGVSGPAPYTKVGIPQKDLTVYIDPQDIIYLEAIKTYTKIITKKEEIVCSYNLGRCKAVLPEEHFFTIHRSYVINLLHVNKYEHMGVVVMNNQTRIPVAKPVREEFLRHFRRIHS